MDAHLLLDGAAADAVALAGIAIAVEHEFRHDEERDAVHTFRRAFDAGEHKMNDVGGEIMLTGGDEDLLS